MKKILIVTLLALTPFVHGSGRANAIRRQLNNATTLLQLQAAYKKINTVASFAKKNRLYQLYERCKAMLSGDEQTIMYREWQLIEKEYQIARTEFEQEHGAAYDMAIPACVELKKEKSTKITDKSGEVLSHGMILGGKSGKVWSAVQSLKKKTKPKENNKAIGAKALLTIIKVLQDTKKYTRAQRLNIACELAVDPDYKSIQQEIIAFIQSELNLAEDMPASMFAQLYSYEELII